MRRDAITWTEWSAEGLVLLIPEKSDPERDAVASEWTAAGGSVLRLGRFWDPPAMDTNRVRVYGNDSFCLVLEQKLGLELCSPDDDLLIRIEPRFLGRSISVSTVASLDVPFPAFVKSLIPKQIPSRVHSSASDFLEQCQGLDPATQLLVSDPVEFVAEARCFVHDGRILDIALYEGTAEVEEARRFSAEVASGSALPRTVVLDVGLLADGRWIVVELNAAWGAGLNGCDPRLVLPAIEAATRPRPLRASEREEIQLAAISIARPGGYSAGYEAINRIIGNGARAYDAYFALGVALRARASFDAAIDAFIHALQARCDASEAARAEYEIGDTYQRRGEPEQARYYFQLVLRARPTLTDARGSPEERIAALADEGPPDDVA